MAFFISGRKFIRQGIHYVKFVKKTKINFYWLSEDNLIKNMNKN
ncbi:MAG: hypothetical protein RL212_217 [Pseudomonadota bacterium]